MINYKIDNDGIAIISINDDMAPVNALGQKMGKKLGETFRLVAENEDVIGIIVTSAKKDFIVGADVKEAASNREAFTKLAVELKKDLRYMETCGKPVVAAINGTALGGGYEVCLACHHRIALNHPKIQIGLPEVTLGLLPGAGGTQRLPRMIGVEKALEPILQGKRLNPEAALKVGMVDELAESPEALISKAKQWIKEKGDPIQPWDKDKFRLPGGNIDSPKVAMHITGAAGNILKMTYGNYPAPKAILNAIYEGLQLRFDRASEVEDRYFKQCVLSDVGRNMMRSLFINMKKAENGAARPKVIPVKKVTKVGILGAGMMGAGIAYVSAMAGIEVILKDISLESAEKGKSYSEELLKKRISKGRINEAKAKEILSLIKPTSSAKDVKDCDLVIEAVFEDRNLKAKVTQESEAVTSDTSIFASNTSTLPITGLAEASARPHNFIGMHFFSPVDKMPLVELIKGEQTSDEAVALSLDYIRQIRKIPIVVNDSRGFYTSRVFTTYILEGLACLQEGISPALIENAGKMVGMPVGPLAVADEVSIELIYKINKQTELDLGTTGDPTMAVAKKFVEELGRLGKKEGKGFYEYPQGGKKHLWSGLSEHYPLSRKQLTAKEVGKRLLHRQALEAVKCLEENVVTSPADADIGSILGWGVPPYTGGLISYIDTIGLKTFVSECEELASKYGDRFLPTPKLKEMATNGESFYQEEAIISHAR
ncbi:3-hydroxyacyl-CoA dehydrogenase NAD-binding domain-containing protein [Limibacter armeniacum]|uniref:3-hydroxyacyl-CoA dehydrogenase NAD-binding domain-containing protein n=1 Tax=Limibacter armeniacum TaxID=466084 RepID=UPI002FE5297B